MISKRHLVDSVIKCLSWSRLPALLRRFQQDEFCILMLHGVTERRDEEGIGNTEGIHIHVEDLEAIFQLLTEHYTVVSLDRVIESMTRKEALPPRSVVLTFDDGYLSNYEMAYPLLKKYGINGTIFTATDFVTNQAWQWWDRLEYALGHTKMKSFSLRIGDGRVECSLANREERRNCFTGLLPVIKALPQELVSREVRRVEEKLDCALSDAANVPVIYKSFNWDQAREMHRSGHVTIGAHTHTHKILGRCTPPTLREELTLCRDIIADQVGVEYPLFSYPNGHIGDHTDETRKAVMDLGFRCALTTDTGFNKIGDDPFTLRRFSTGNSSRYVDVTASGAMRMLLSINHAIRGRRQEAA